MLFQSCSHIASVPWFPSVPSLRDDLRRRLHSLSAARRAAPSRQQLQRRSLRCCAEPADVKAAGSSKDPDGFRHCGLCEIQRPLRHFRVNRGLQGKVVNYATVCGGCAYKRKLIRRLVQTEARELAEAVAEVERRIGSQPDRLCTCCQEQLPSSFFSPNPANHQCRTCLNDKVREIHAQKNHPAAAEKQCNKCNKILPGSLFDRDKTNSTGLKSLCKSCYLVCSRANNALIRAAPLLPSGPLPAKICIRCAETKPLIEYGTASVKDDGHDNICKQCVRIRRTKPVEGSAAGTS